MVSVSAIRLGLGRFGRGVNGWRAGGHAANRSTMTPALILLGYLLGSIPFGLILTRLGGAGDIRQIGSGNIGATNVLRTGRTALAAATLILDAAKGAAAVLIARAMHRHDEVELLRQLVHHGGLLTVHTGIEAGLAALVGHCYPVWLRFRGGKGVATLLGLTLAAWWPAGLATAAAWAGAMAITRISSAGGLAAAIVAPLAMFASGRPDLGVAMVLAASLVWWRHRDNLAAAGARHRAADRCPCLTSTRPTSPRGCV